MSESNIVFNKNTLKALLLFAAKKDVRYYLNGIHIVVKNGVVTLTASDGHTMIRLIKECHESVNIDLIIPRYIVEHSLKVSDGCKSQYVLFQTESNKLGQLWFDPIDAKYPEFNVKAIKDDNPPDDTVAFNVIYLLRLQNAYHLENGSSYRIPRIMYSMKCARVDIGSGFALAMAANA